MSIQYKSIKNLTSMLQNKEISHKELINETFTLIESKTKMWQLKKQLYLIARKMIHR